MSFIAVLGPIEGTLDPVAFRFSVPTDPMERGAIEQDFIPTRDVYVIGRGRSIYNF